MKHIREYEEQEIRDLMGDLEKVGQNPPKGWVLAVFPFDVDGPLSGGFQGTRYYAITAYSEEEAYLLVAEAAMGELDREELKELISDASEFSDLEDIVNSASDHESGFVYLREWKGLVPKSKDPKVVVIEDSNPFVVIKELNQEFTNAESVMSTNI